MSERRPKVNRNDHGLVGIRPFLLSRTAERDILLTNALLYPFGVVELSDPTKCATL